MTPTEDAAAASAGAEFSQGNPMELAFRDIVAEQPSLGPQVDNYIGMVGRDPVEKKQMKTAVVLACLFFEAQAAADRQLDQVEDTLPVSSGSLFPTYAERKPDESLLPIVDNATRHSTLAILSARPGLIDATYWQLLEKQPELSHHLESGRDAAEKQRIIEMMAIPYFMLTAQADVDRTKLLAVAPPA